MYQYRLYLQTGRLDFNEYEEDDYSDLDENFMPAKKVYIKEKYKRNYDYLYDMTRYDTLLHRGLEYLSEDEFQDRLTGKVVDKLPEVKVMRVTR